MTPSREVQKVEVISYTEGKNDYGQPMVVQDSSRLVDMIVKPYSNSMVNNPRYNDCELIALTMDRDVRVSNALKIDNIIYDIDFIIPSFRYNQLLLRKYK